MAAEEIKGLDQILAALSISGFVFRTPPRARADQAYRRLPSSHWPVSERSSDLHFRRIAEARLGGEAI